MPCVPIWTTKETSGRQTPALLCPGSQELLPDQGTYHLDTHHPAPLPSDPWISRPGGRYDPHSIQAPPWRLIGSSTSTPYIAFIRLPAFDSEIEKAGFRFPEREGRVIYASGSATKQAADRGAALKLRGTKPR